MTPRQNFARASARAQWRRPLGIATASIAAVALGVVGLTGPVDTAAAQASDTAEAEGRLITGGGAVNLNDIAELAGAYSADPSAPGPVEHPLSIEVLNSLDLDLGDGVQLFGENGVLALGALGQYASTGEGSVPLASSGLIGADGSIAPASGDPGENAYLDLTPLLQQAGLSELLDQARVELGAISASATIGENGEPVGDYQIASGTLIMTSPTIEGLSGTLSESLGEVSGPINDLTGEGGTIATTVDPLLDGLTETLNTVLLGIGSIDDLGVTATVDLDLQSALDSVLAQPLTSEDSAVTIDFSTGEVSVDLARLVADTQGGDYDGSLNGLPPNTEVLGPDVIQAALDGAIGSIFDQIPELVVNAVTDALHAADVNIAITGEINALGELLPPVGTVDVQVSGTLGDFIGAEGSTEPEVDTSGTSIAGLPVGQLVDPIVSSLTDTILPALVTPLSEAVTDEGTLDTIFRPAVEAVNETVSPLATLITENLISLTANVQESPGNFVDENGYDEGAFTERALSLTLLPQDPLISLSLASATVRVDAAAQAAITVTPEEVQTGETITTDGTGYSPESEVTVTYTDVDGNEIGSQTVTTDADGNFTTDFVVPDGTPPGTLTVTAVEGDNSATDTTEVVDSGAADSTSDATSDATADSTADATDDSTSDSTTDATSDSTADATSDASADSDANANASASAAASANADDNSNASAQAAAEAAANADATSAASAAADSDATAAAAAAAQADASTDASADISSDANASAAAAANAAANADNSSDTNADSSAAAEGNAAAAADAAAIADASTDASATAAANADATSDASADDTADASDDSTADATSDATADSTADATDDSTADATDDSTSDASADSDANANASASAAASADADDNSNASAQAAAEAAANADATSAASAAADSDATAAAAAAAQADASTDASADISSDANASAAAAANAAANADNSAATNADASAAAEGNAAAAADAAAIADASTDASATAAANATADADGDDGELVATIKYATIVRGTGVTEEVYGSGFEPGESVTATVHSTPFELEAVTANESGDVTFTFDVGSDFELGDHYVTLVGATSGEVPAANTHTDFTVVDDTGSATATGASGTADATGTGGADSGDNGWLPDTGSTIGPGVLIGALLLILIGSGLALVSRRRRGQQH